MRDNDYTNQVDRINERISNDDHSDTIKVVGRKAMNGVLESLDDEEIFKQVMS